MPIIEQVADALQDVFGSVAQRLARDTRFVQRESKLGGAHFVQTLVFTYLANPNATLEELCQTAAALGIELTPAGLTQRFTEAAATFLQAVLAAAVTRTLAADPLAIPLLERFAGVYLEESTVMVLPDALRSLWPGCGNATEQGAAALKSTCGWTSARAAWPVSPCTPDGCMTRGQRNRCPPCLRGRCSWPIWDTSAWTASGSSARREPTFSRGCRCKPRSSMPTTAAGTIWRRCWRLRGRRSTCRSQWA